MFFLCLRIEVILVIYSSNTYQDYLIYYDKASIKVFKSCIKGKNLNFVFFDCLLTKILCSNDKHVLIISY